MSSNRPIRRPRRAAVLAAVFCGLTVTAAQSPGAPGGKAPPPYAPDSTYAKRVAASPRNQPLKTDSLVFPHPHVLGRSLSGPVQWKAGQKPSRRYRDADRFFWTSVPARKAHAEYLAKRTEMIDKKQDLTLISWCERNNLPLCAEFELRRLLCNRMNFRDSGYQSLRRRWVRHADKRQIETTFPLPVEGEWHVVVDRTGHHRIKHGAAYAWDFVIKKGRTFHKGNARRLEDYYAWGRPVIAQADGLVTGADDKHPDMPIGKRGGFANANIVVVDYGGGIRALYAHLQKGSLAVKIGDKVTLGQTLGRVGNSGASGMPHLHFSFLDGASFSIKGRYRCQVLSFRQWKLHDGKDLRGGTTVRNKPPAGS